MNFYSESLKLHHNTFVLLRDLIQERTGLFFEENKMDILADKLSPLVIERGFGSFLDYYYLLKYDGDAAEEWGKVVDVLTVQETFFWREVDQIRTVADVIVPRHFEAFPEKPFQIWSVPCATGEEPLSIAMALDQKGCFGRYPIRILGADISPSAIGKAHRGLYRERAFRNLPAALKERYFTREGDLWRVDETLQSRIQWGLLNLLDEASPLIPDQVPVIFCRNVFIYFTPPTIRRVVKMFYERMPVPGYLFVAASESLLKLTTDFELQEIGGAFVYVKK
ncbi:MAG TPA: protein-glutamate O-methyltransferase CheR [Smithellaceae bacterium]|nr:protein-glutamate O-methyltransferase CheR [Smithellaceae bacterium]